MKGTAVALAGRIGSGKTSVAIALAHRLGWPYVGFGDYVRSEAVRQGLDPESREVLQRLGQDLLRQDLDGFCRAVLAQSDRAPRQGLIVDGVRHIAVLDTLRRLLAPIPVRLIYLAVSNDVRQLRLDAAGRCAGCDAAGAEDHPSEMLAALSLPATADAVLDGNRDLDAVVADALACVVRAPAPA